ncbi:MAG: ornithine cyclodeaminase family protein [Actinobacteria bacterium]|nr:ornithine cyclodeaminase family protein [Actinomycetota bacterium]
MPLYLTEVDVDQLADMALALEAVEGSLRRQGEGLSANIGRRRARTPGAALHVMGAADPRLGVAGAKVYLTGRVAGARFAVVLFDTASGDLAAIIEARRLGELRTGAASGISAKYLAHERVDTVGLIGAGRQARTQLEAVCALRRPARVQVYARTPIRVAGFLRAAQREAAADLQAVGSAEAAVRDAQIVITATSAAQPVLQGEWLQPGMHVIAMGSNHPAHQELDAAAVARADRIFVDDLDGAQQECGDLIAAHQAGTVQWGQVLELGLVVAGRVPGRARADEITIFESQGIALWDIALAHAVWKRAEAAGAGTRVGD